MCTKTLFNMILLFGFMTDEGLAGDQAIENDVLGDVRRYGAVCDNKADDTAALVRAGQSNNDVYIAETMVCRVTGPIADGIRPNQRWYGGGKITTPDDFNFTVFSVVGKTNVTIDGLVAHSGALRAPYKEATARFVEYVSGSHRGRVINSKITGFQQAVRLHNSTNVTVDNNDIDRPDGWGISIQAGAHDATITNNRIVGTIGEHGIYVSGSRSNLVRTPLVQGNTVSGSKVDGIKLSFVDGAVVAGNESSVNSGQGLYVTIGASRADIHDNIVDSNAAAGILVFDGTTTSTENRVHHNTVRTNHGAGIVVTSSWPGSVIRTEVSSNDVVGNGRGRGAKNAGITITGPLTTLQTSIAGNRIQDQGIGIYVVGRTDVIIGSNFFENCDSEVIENEASAAR